MIYISFSASCNGMLFVSLIVDFKYLQLCKQKQHWRYITTFIFDQSFPHIIKENLLKENKSEIYLRVGGSGGVIQ